MSNLVYTFDYNNTYDPSFPSVEIWLSKPEQTQDEAMITALVDSGSDGTLIPVDVLVSLKAICTDRVRVRGLFGGSNVIDLYLVNLRLGPHRFPNIEVVGVDEGSEALLGRNVQNRLAVLLDGPAEAVEITE